MLRITIFLSIVMTILGSVHFFLWARLVHDPKWPGPWQSVGTGLVLTFFALTILALFAHRVMPKARARVFSWSGYVWMGLMFYLFMLLIPFEILRWISDAVALASSSAISSLPLSSVYGFQLIAGFVIGVSIALVTGGMISVARGPRIRNVSVHLKKLSPALSGFRIVQVTDIHFGPTIGREFAESMVARVNALNPDVIAITGDLIDGSVSELARTVEPLRNLHATHGVYFVTGNHEYYSGVVDWVSHLETLGIRVLRNERVPVHKADATIDIAGVDDWSAKGFGHGHGANLKKALEGRDPSHPVILLAHQPKAIREASQMEVDLQISGHTHGGQLIIFNWLTRLDQPAVAGLYRFGPTQLYVSRGTGYWGPPMRVGVPAEITAIELYSVRNGSA